MCAVTVTLCFVLHILATMVLICCMVMCIPDSHHTTHVARECYPDRASQSMLVVVAALGCKVVPAMDEDSIQELETRSPCLVLLSAIGTPSFVRMNSAKLC